MLWSGVALAAPATITRAHSRVVATAISVRHGDVAAFKEESNPYTPQEQRSLAQQAACTGGVAPSAAYAITQSPLYISTGNPLVGEPSLIISSSAEILPSGRLVSKDLAATLSRRGLNCLRSEFQSTLKASLPKSDAVTSTIARLPGMVPMADGFVTRITFRVSTHGTETTYADNIGFADGQAEVVLQVLSVGAAPPVALERRLADLLVSRARNAIG